LKRIYLICLACVILLSACSWWSKQEPEKTADELATEGQTYFEDGKYSDAIKAYAKLGDWYPFSVHAKAASLQIAEAHYFLEEYDEAVLAYSEYERMHPNDEKVPYVIYQIGMCHFEQIEAIDQDSTATENALATFRRLTEQFPDNEYTKKAQPLMATCVSDLAAKEMYVGRFYFKSEKYKAALHRFEGVIVKYPYSEFTQEALDSIVQCKTLIAAEEAALALEAEASTGEEK